MDPIERLRLMAILCDSVCDLRGGHLATCLNMHLAHGSPAVQAFVSLWQPASARGATCLLADSFIDRLGFVNPLTEPLKDPLTAP